MKSIGIVLSILSFSILFIGYGKSATIIVPTGQPTVAAAIAASSSGDTILINPGFYSTDSINIVDKSLTIMGNGGKPILPMGASTIASGFNTFNDHSGGVVATLSRSYLGGNSMTVNLSNLIIIPTNQDSSGNRAYKGMCFETQANVGLSTTLIVNITDCIITPNDGSNQPISTTGLSFVGLPGGSVSFQDHGLLTRGNVNATLVRVISTNNRGGTGGSYGFRFAPTANGNYTTSMDGCISSYNDSIGVGCFNSAESGVAGNIFNISGSSLTTRNKIISNGYANTGFGDIVVFASTGNVGSKGKVTINNTDIISGNQHSLMTKNNGTSGIPLSITNCRIVGSSVASKNAIELDDSVSYIKATVANCTFIVQNSSGYGLDVAGAGNTTGLVVNNCIFSGTSGIGKGINNDGTSAAVRGAYLDFAISGVNALTVDTSGAGPIVLTSGTILYDDPFYLQSTSVTSIDFLDVTNNTFGQGNSGLTPLNGGASYFGVVPSLDFVKPGSTRTYTVTGGIGPYNTWTITGLPLVGILSTNNNFAVVTAGFSAGTTFIGVKDSLNRSTFAGTIVITPTSAPMIQYFEMMPVILSDEIKLP